MFHGIIGEIVEHVRPTTEADDMAMVGSLLTAFGGAAGTKPHVVAGDERHPMLAWTLLLGPTGNGRKGTGTAAVSRFLEWSDPYYWNERKTNSLSTGEGLIFAVRDGLSAGDIESEGHKITPGVEDKRLFVLSSEFAGVMSKTGGGTLGTVLRDAWDGKKTLKILTKESETATGSHIAVLGHVTPEEFGAKLKLSDMDGGTYNRFLPLYVYRSKAVPFPERNKEWEKKSKELGDKLKASLDRAKNVEEITLNSHAKKFWIERLYGELTDVDEGAAKILQSFTNRRAPYALRVAALYALMNGRSQINKKDLESAKALIDYAYASAEFVTKDFSPLGARGSRARTWDQDKSALTDLLTDAGEAGVTRTEVIKFLGSGRRSKDEIDVLLEDVGAQERRVRVPPATKHRQMIYLPKQESK
ncbi:hypothetical protein O1L55_20800 [Streptomyces albulus]|nr:hypothetical protein [Streptomyces noursei]